MDDDDTSDLAAKTTAYAQVGENYRAIDDFRLRLLALLPLATATGILLLLQGEGLKDSACWMAMTGFGRTSAVSGVRVLGAP